MSNEEVSCKDHPDAPHGFCRDLSHTYDRYVCECEFWEPEEPKIYTLSDIEAAVLAEREVCAKMCDEEITIDDEAFNDGVNACAAAIRAMGDHA